MNTEEEVLVRTGCENEEDSSSYRSETIQEDTPTETNSDKSNAKTETGAVRDMGLYTSSSFLNLSEGVMLGKHFYSIIEAESFFQRYSQCVGFGLRKDEKRMDGTGTIRRRRWVCRKEGIRKKKPRDQTEDQPLPKREPRSETRTNCKASFRVNYDLYSFVWKITQWNDKHNHELCTADYVPHLISNRIVPEGVVKMVESMKKVGVKTHQIMEYVVEQNKGYLHPGFIKKDLQNRIDAERKLNMTDGDAVSALGYLYAQAEKDPGYFLKYSVDEDHALHNIFWCDSIMKSDYMIFGEVLGFDSTYKINAYRKPLVVFIGVNHHFRTNVFGFGLLANETEDSYIWLLNSFLQAMGQKKPKCVITDSDPAILVAVQNVFPNATHRLCSWHLSKNAGQHLDKSGEQAKGFIKCMKRNQDVFEFERHWEHFVSSHGLGSNSWIQKMGDKKEMWAEAYLRGKFFAMMKANQRCESMNSYLKHFVHWSLKMFEFVRQIDRSVRRIRHIETYEDFIDFDGTPELSTHLRDIEKQAANILTKQIFFKFRDRIRKEILVVLEGPPTVMPDRIVYTCGCYRQPDKRWVVEYFFNTGHMSCSCKGLESDGIPCKHAIAVMKQEKVKEIPMSMFHVRWHKNAKTTFVNSRATTRNDEEAQMTRYGALAASSAKLLYLGSKSLTGFNLVMEKMTQLTSYLEDLLLREESVTLEQEVQESGGTIVKDPKVVRSKGCGPMPNKETSRVDGKNRCKYCEGRGHNARGCQKRKDDEIKKTGSRAGRNDMDTERSFQPNTQSSQNNQDLGSEDRMDFNFNIYPSSGVQSEC